MMFSSRPLSSRSLSFSSRSLSPDNKEREATVYKLKHVEPMDDNVFVFYGTTRLGVNRNMVVVRHTRRQELTLVNPIRLDAEGQARLRGLGKIERLIRLAPRQGAATDRYYLKTFRNLRRWAPGEAENLPIHRHITAEDDCLLPGCHVFTFRDTAEPECALLIRNASNGNLLVTAEALQAQKGNRYINPVIRARMAANGLMEGDLGIPKNWIKEMSLNKRSNTLLKADFERLLDLDFERSIGASGVMINQGAKERAIMAVEVGFPMLEV